jgi:hypothetical protein
MEKENKMNLQESIRKDLEAIDAPIITEEQGNSYKVKVTASQTGYVTITAESEEDAIYQAEVDGAEIAARYDPEGKVTAEIVNDASEIEGKVNEGMPEEKEEQIHELLVFIIQTLDHEFYKEIQSTNNPIGLIRHKVDQVLNH